MSAAISMGLVPLAHRRDPIAPGPRLRVRIDVVPSRTSVPGMERPVKQGIQEVIISASALPSLQAKVETEWNLVARAEEIHDTRLRTWLRDKTKIEPAEDPADWSEQHTKLEKMYGDSSVSSVFRELTESRQFPTGRDIRPLRSIEVLDELPPETDERLQMARDVAAELSAVRSTGAPLHVESTTELDEMRMLLAKQSEEIAALKAALSPKRGRQKKVQQGT